MYIFYSNLLATKYISLNDIVIYSYKSPVWNIKSIFISDKQFAQLKEIYGTPKED